MEAINIENTAVFLNKLFNAQTFDEFLLMEGSVSTFATFNLDGRMLKNHFSEEEYSSMPEPRFLRWGSIRPIIRNYLTIWSTQASVTDTTQTATSATDDIVGLFGENGKLKLVLSLTAEQTKKLVAASGSDIPHEQVEGLFINIRYESGTLTCITGTSLKIFTMDKSLEQYFDKYTANFLGRIC